MVLAVLNMIDAELRQRPGIGGFQQIQHKPVSLENVIYSEKDITPLSEFLIDTVTLKKSSHDRYLAQGRRAFMPIVPFTAHLELEIMQGIIQHWGEETFVGELDAVTLAISGIRRALASLRPSPALVWQKGGSDA